MTSFILKLIAAASMLIDHAGLILFPEAGFMRLIGRLAFPIYAYCIAEGFRYTRNRSRYFLRIAALASACQLVYAFVDDTLYLGVLVSFSISIILMQLLELAKKSVGRRRVAFSALFGAGIAAALALCLLVEVDYGFFGLLLPVSASLFESKKKRLTAFAVTLLILCIDVTAIMSVQYFSLFAIPLLAMYNGERGRFGMKYFFYIFYPLHLAVLWGIDMLI